MNKALSNRNCESLVTFAIVSVALKLGKENVGGGSVAEWSVDRNRNHTLPIVMVRIFKIMHCFGFESRSDHHLDLIHGTGHEFKSSATLVNSKLVCLRPVCYDQFEFYLLGLASL